MTKTEIAEAIGRGFAQGLMQAASEPLPQLQPARKKTKRKKRLPKAPLLEIMKRNDPPEVQASSGAYDLTAPTAEELAALELKFASAADDAVDQAALMRSLRISEEPGVQPGFYNPDQVENLMANIQK